MHSPVLYHVLSPTLCHARVPLLTPTRPRLCHPLRHLHTARLLHAAGTWRDNLAEMEMPSGQSREAQVARHCETGRASTGEVLCAMNLACLRSTKEGKLCSPQIGIKFMEHSFMPDPDRDSFPPPWYVRCNHGNPAFLCWSVLGERHACLGVTARPRLCPPKQTSPAPRGFGWACHRGPVGRS